MQYLKRVFIHGLDSSGQGTKAMFFRDKYPEVICEDYVGSLNNKMNQLERVLAGTEELVLIGSSYGGLMAALYGLAHPERIRRLVLLAPALTMTEFRPVSLPALARPVFIYHGINDDLIPAGELELIARRHFSCLTFELLEDDHLLHLTFRLLPWKDLLEYSP
jgi:pimeloyl-ACP methyl ester carboxylesterase